MNAFTPKSDNLDGLLLTTGTVLPANRSGAAGAKGVTLIAGTYVFPLPVAEEDLVNVTLAWAAAVTASAITIEVCNAPAVEQNQAQGPTDVTDFANAAEWVPYNPAASGTNYASATGTGNTATAMTLVAGGTAAGQAVFNLADLGARRARLKVVASVGGVMRVMCNGKRVRA